MKHLFYSWVVIGLGVLSCTTHKPDNNNFSFCLLNNKLSADDISKIELSAVVLQDSPIFTVNDILAYSKSEHALNLTNEAFKRFTSLEAGTPFAICVGKTPIYLGIVWSQVYSSSFNGIVAVAVNENDSNKILILAGYPNKRYFKGIDPRENQLILNSFERCNKLVE